MYDGTLRPDDLSRIAEERDLWMRVGLSTERCDRQRVEAAVREVYRTAGLAEPALIVWMDSPMGGAFASGVVRELLAPKPDQLWDQLWDQLGGQLGGQLRDQLWDQLGDQLGGQLRGQLGDQLGDQLGGQLGGQLRDQLGGQLGGQLRGQLGGQLGDQLWDQLWDQLGGQLGGQLRGQLGGQLRGQLGGQLRGQVNLSISPWWDAYWLAYYNCALPLADLSNARLEAMVALQQEAAWWWPMQGAVVLTDRPVELHLDQQVRFHKDDGPAVVYADGWAVDSWHGISVPADFWTWDVERALSESNSEIRRCAIERLGWEQVTDRLMLVAEADDPGNAPHKIRLYDLPKDMADLYEQHARILVVSNASLDKGGHRRVFGLPVPGRHSDPIEAAADLFGIPATAYAQVAHAS